MQKRLIMRVLALVVSAMLFVMCSVAVSAAVDNTLNLANAKKNLRGDGYEWNNPDRILTLNDLDIDTSDDFGLKIPDNCTVVLKGKNTVKAAKFGLGVPGSVTFEGDGELTIEAGSAAVYNYSYSNNHKMRFGAGSYSFSAETAILADRAEISVTGGSLELHSTGDVAVDARVFSVSGGTVDALGAISADHLIDIDRADVTVSAKGAALVSGNMLKLENVKLSVGASHDSLASADEYNGESVVKTVLIKKGARASILFGENVPITVDYALLAAAVLLIGCAVVLPILRKRAKVKKLYESLEAEKTMTEEKKKNGKKTK
ncbi:MAG: hypothetical protein IJ457_02330 [Clostridia bacterium]|nr:hypothetical protein [Clostridia bacterium]